MRPGAQHCLGSPGRFCVSGAVVKISVASGKGGTGKTTVAVGLALAARSAVLVDCDAEEPNCHIFLRKGEPRVHEVLVPVPSVDAASCSLCGTCARACRFNALAVAGGRVVLFEKLCHGCGVCAAVCPSGAITEVNRRVGVVEVNQDGPILVITGRLDVGEASPVPVIRAAKSLVPGEGLTILDCAPGTSCAVVEAVKGSDLCLLVTEPTPFGLHDLQMAADTVAELGVPAAVVVNRSDGQSESVKDFCRARGLRLAAELPADRRAAESYSVGKHPSLELEEWNSAFRTLLDVVVSMV